MAAEMSPTVFANKKEKLFVIATKTKVLGDIGNRTYYRCNGCGLEWKRKIEQTEDSKPNEDYLRGVPKKW